MNTVVRLRQETFYWMTLTFSQTPAALGDWATDGALGYLGGAIVFAVALAVLAGLYPWRGVSRC